jgi:hypothetical protein
MRNYILCFIGFSLSLQADTLHLRDGRTLNGQFVSATSTQIRFAVDGNSTQTFPLSSVSNVAFDSAESGTRARRGESIVPSGTVVTVRTIDPINSDKSDVGQTFAATLDEPLVVNGRTLAEKGADVKLRVVEVDQQSGLSGSEEISLALDQITVNGSTYKVVSNNAEVAAKNKNSESVKVVGGTAVVGAIIGAIAGGGKGAAIGAASGAGAGAAIQAIRGQRVQIPAESVLDFQVTEVQEAHR